MVNKTYRKLKIKSKDNTMANKKRTQRANNGQQNTIYIHRILNTEQHEPH